MVKATIAQTNDVVSTEPPVEKIKKKPGRKPGQKNKPSSKKPGRKPKSVLIEAEESTTEKKVPKKRGRKPKGGKIMDESAITKKTEKASKPNIILHLKCNTTDLFNEQQIFYESSNIKNEINYHELEKSKEAENQQTNKYKNRENIILKKLKLLNEDLKLIVDNKKSNCFWCTYSFDNYPFYIPKNKLNNTINVYGCFCSPECSMAFLFNENLDSSTKWERISLLNYLYGSISGHNKPIKPAPNPFYTLEKYYGNLTIEEYRKTFTYDEMILLINKPITQIIPEIYQDNNEFNKNMNVMNNFTSKVKQTSMLNSFKIN